MPPETTETYTFTPSKRGFFSASGKKKSNKKSSKGKSKSNNTNKSST